MVPSHSARADLHEYQLSLVSTIFEYRLSAIDFARLRRSGRKCLPCLTGLSVQYRHGWHSIEFRYERTPCIHASKKLGRCDISEVPPSTLFKIDGGSGERITAIDIAVQKPRALQAANAMFHEAPKEIRFITNHGRKCEFGTSNVDDHLQRLAPTERTAITGLYAHQDLEIGLYSLGLISEAARELY
ncbi:hypothetical protein ABVK25_003678 [Lepraria finkii]|uniref:Uncharacterized protein n=1 Tax=Lepraria finkii TaxID=1340010 RepID=A0ABR4BDW9_9LECA